jgi:hypothetical protein
MEQRTSPPQGQELANLEEDPINLPLHEERYEPLVAGHGRAAGRRVASRPPHTAQLAWMAGQVTKAG